MNDLLVTRDEALKSIQKVIEGLDSELENVKLMLNILSREHAQFKLLRN